MKKFLLLLSAALIHPASQAQTLQEMMEQASDAAQKKGESRVRVEENLDPLPPLGFTGSMRMEVRSYINGSEQKDSPARIDLAFDNDRMAMAPVPTATGEEVRVIMDLTNRHNTTLMTDASGKRTAVKMRLMKFSMKDGAGSSDDVRIEETGNTKVIQGYTCHQVRYSSPDGAGEAWIARDVRFDLMDAFARITGGRNLQGWQRGRPDGLVLESDWTSANGKERHVMTIQDLVVGNVDESRFSAAGYEVQDLTSMPAMMGR